jgi:spermidine synthase
MELRYMFKDGIMSSGILKMEGNLSDYEFLKGYLQSAPYQFRKYRSVISIGFGGGIDLWIAAYHRLRRIIGVEINPLKVEILKGEFKTYSGNLSEKAILIGEEGRHFLAKRDLKVDVIQMSGLDSYPALSSGAFALSENYVFTKEAIQSMLEHLNPEGVISINRIMFDPPRETLRMVSTMIKAMGEKEGIGEHFFILKGSRWGEILLKNTPFTEEEAKHLLEWAEEMRFAVVYNPFELERDNHFSRFIGMSPEERKKFYQEYVYKITPATDNSPFFFQYYKWKNLFKEKKSRWGYAVLMPVGLKLIIYSLLQVSLLGLLFIILPVAKLKVSATPFVTRNTLFYFAFIGLGFILVEIIVIQKLLVFLGGPLYSLSVALFSILVFSGLGSYFSPLITDKFKNNIYLIFISITGISLFYVATLSKILEVLMHLSTPVRIIMSVGLLAPLSFFMGMPFPRAVRFLSRNHNDLIPWAWAVNSIFTVFGSIFCLFLSISLGFHLTWIIAIFFYLLAMLVILNLERK